jgi:Flp pilus assembly protein TadG
MSTRNRRTGQRGQETLQAILVVALVLLPMLVAILTFATLVHTSIATEAAAAAGARAAGVAGQFGAEEMDRVAEELQANGIDASACRVDASAQTVRLDQPIRVTVACPQHVGIPFLFERDVQLSSTVVARGEVNR